MFIIIIDKITHIPGDERSRTNPGHGYGPHDEHSYKIEEFDDGKETALKARIVQLNSRKEKFRVIKGSELNVAFTTDVKLS